MSKVFFTGYGLTRVPGTLKTCSESWGSDAGRQIFLPDSEWADHVMETMDESWEILEGIFTDVEGVTISDS